MKHFVLVLALLHLSSFLMSAAVATGQIVIDAHLGLPRGSLTMEDETERARQLAQQKTGSVATGGVEVFFSHAYQIGGQSGARISLAATSANAMWAGYQLHHERYQLRFPEWEARYAKLPGATNHPQHQATMQASLRQFAYPGLGYGMVGPFGGVGPGGETYLAAFHLPKLNRDFVLSLVVSSRAESHMGEKELALLGKLEGEFHDRTLALMDAMVSQIAGRSVKAEEISWHTNAAKVFAQFRPAAGPDGKAASATNAPAAKQTAASPKPAPSKESHTNLGKERPWLIGLVFAALAVIAWFLLRGRGQ